MNEHNIGHKIKTNGYNSFHLTAKRSRKRAEAESRKAEHESLTIQEKIEKARSRRGNSTKELNRLLAQAKENGIVVSNETPKTTKKATKKTVKKKIAKKATKKVAKKV